MQIVDRLIPVSTHRRVLVKALARSVRQPSAARRVLDRRNFQAMWRYRDTEALCTICGHRGRLLLEFQDHRRLAEHHIGDRRETLRCRACRAKMRDRTLAVGLLDAVADLTGVHAASVRELAGRLPEDFRILETDGNSRIARELARVTGVTRSLYVDDAPSGAVLDPAGTINVDLQEMPFPDASFDVILSTEVMEHVRFPERAHREIARCLAPGGHYVFTVPYDDDLERTWELIDPESDTPLVLPMHLHGDPDLRPDGIKSYRVFGRDLVDDLEEAGLVGRFELVDRPEAGIFGGDLFVARLPAG